MSSLPPLLVQALGEFQRIVGEGNAAKGFHAEGDALRNYVSEWDSDIDKKCLRRYYSEKLLLIVSEVTEAQDELRTGHHATETYYNVDGEVTYNKFSLNGDGPHKPEGVPSELADVVIRAFDLAAETGIDLAGMIAEKLAYNATRPFMHGKKF